MVEEIAQSKLVDQLIDLGVQMGGVLLVHTAFSRVRPLQGGPEGLIAALQAAVGPEGTLVMPSMFYEDDIPFDPGSSPCPEMGVVAETFWRLPGVLRSDNAMSFAARGPLAAHITAPHPIAVPHGLDSPVGRVYELDGQVLLLGAGQDANTTLHLAENLAGVRYRHHSYVTIMQDGQPVQVEFEEVDHCCQKFTLLDGWLEQRGLLRRGTVGHGPARLMRARQIVATAREHLQQNETVFLHPFGTDEDCDLSWESLGHR